MDWVRACVVVADGPVGEEHREQVARRAAGGAAPRPRSARPTPDRRQRTAVSSRWRYTASSQRRRVARPAAVATGFPDSVPAWYTGPSGASSAMMSARPPNAPTGSPPPITLPNVIRSGAQPSTARVQPVHAGSAHPEAGHHLVGDQQRAVGVGDRGERRR